MKCSQCNSQTFKSVAMGHDRKGLPLGEFPLYYVGNPFEPHLASHYFCDAYCANTWYKENRDA